MTTPRPARLLVLLTAGLVALLGCGTQTSVHQPESEAPTSSAPITLRRSADAHISIITVFPDNNFYQSMLCGARQAADELGGLTVDIHGSQTIASSEQLAVFEEVIQGGGSDGVILVPWDSVAFIEPVRAQVAAGLPVVTADGSLDEPVDLQNITTDNTEGGRILAEHMSEVIGDGAVIGVVTASPTDTVQLQRTEGFVDRLRQLKPDVTVLPYAYAESDPDLTHELVASWLATTPEIEGIFLSSGEAAEGAGRAATEAGREDLIVYTFDAFESTVDLLRQGIIQGILAQSPYDMGYVSALTVGRLVQGTISADQLEPYQLHSAMLFIDRSNIDDPESDPFRQDQPGQCPYS